MRTAGTTEIMIASMPLLSGAPATEDPDISLEDARAYMRTQTREVLATRAVAQILIILAAIALYSAAKFWFEPQTPFAWYGPSAGLVAVQLFALSRVRRYDSIDGLEHLLLANSAVVCAVTAWIGIVAGRTTGSDLLLLGLAMLSSALLPWRTRMQAILVTIVGLAIAGNAYGVTGAAFTSIGFPTLVPAAVVLAASIYTSRALELARLHGARADLMRARAEAQTRELNVTLERRVAERTAELEAANKEMEAFSYSVSHDLRAPLRAMNGFGEALLEDYADVLDAHARDYLQRIAGEASRLGRLVDDLLELSRVTHAVIHRRRVDMSALAAVVVGRLRERNPGHEVEFHPTGCIHENCDETLARVLLENLFDNAFKFSSKQQQPRIEFGVDNDRGEPVYFVRDNGIGFDMAYAGRLFGAFERLHRIDEFDGTGIGLATADRIVKRHGGTLTAEAAPGKGATFRFTLRPPGEAA